MSKALSNLLSILSLEKLEEGLFRAQSQDLGFGHLFGGQVLGQALNAAKHTAPSDRSVHSFHSYFLRAGDQRLPVIYDVENVRDGGSFSARRVKAIQKGKPIFYMTCSFQAYEEGFNHQSNMPQVQGPEGLLNQTELAKTLVDIIPESTYRKWTSPSPIEMRVVEPQRQVKPEATDTKRYVWMKANGAMPDDAKAHRYLLAYASDFNFLLTSAQPHGVTFLTPGLKMATIDHSMWFHRPFSLDEWLLFCIDSPSASNGRGFVRGEFYNQKGELVASAAQEGLFRLSTRK